MVPDTTPDHWAWREGPVAHPGQAVVFYDGEYVVGGGTIDD